MFTLKGFDLDSARDLAIDVVATVCDWWTRFTVFIVYWLTTRGYFCLDRRPLVVGTPRNQWAVHFVGASVEGKYDDAARRRAAALFAAGCPTVKDFCAEFDGAAEVRAVVSASISISGTGEIPSVHDRPPPSEGEVRAVPTMAITWKGPGDAVFEDGAKIATLSFTEGCLASMVFSRPIAQKRS